MQPLLADADFRRYLVARLLSLAGNLATLIALPVLVYRVSGSASLTALVAGCEAAPYAVLGLVAGALTDRWDRRRVMVSADLCSTVVVASVPVAHALGVLTVPHLLVVAFLGPSIGVFFDGAVFGAVPTLVGRDRIAAANSYLWTAQNALEIGTPSLVGVVLAMLHPAWLLGVDALTYLASAALVAGIVRPLHDATRERPPLSVRQVGRDIRDGLSWLVRHAGVRTMTLVGTTQSLAGGGFVALMVVWADRRLGVGTEGWRFGVVWGSWAAGGLVASAALPWVLRRTTPAGLTLVALPFSAVLGLLTPVWDAWWAAALNLGAWAVAYMAVVVNSITYRQQVTPEHLLGRVNTAGRMLSWGVGWTGGALLAGVLSAAVGLRPTQYVVTAVTFVGVAVAWTSPLVAELRGGRRTPGVSTVTEG